ncbi:portal protein [Luteibacter sp.]|uniref:portal protein n=1 Tax=Luteibacter sp. TaxID=1886636 RepID=UPI002806726E|nr:portal protein [Luteibacter sp.]MDQ8050728.1 portal protein [Luteibacter sp.]
MADGSPIASESLCTRLNRRLSHLQRDRTAWEPHWRELADNFKPRSGNWNNQAIETRGGKQPASARMINNTPLRAARTLAAGMMAGLTSPARPWFRLGTHDTELDEYQPVKEWLWTVERRMRAVLSKSNVYRVLPTMYGELGVFGITAAIGLEDDQDTIRLQPWEIGSYWCAQDARLSVDTGYRLIKMTVRQLVTEFGLTNCSTRVQSMWASGNWEQWIDVYQAVEPNDEREAGKRGPRGMSVRSVYWEKGGDKDRLLSRRGFEDSPLLVPRWIAEGNNTYGDSPAMDALGDAKGLQFEERRKAQSLDKLVDPPMTAPTSLRNSRVSLLPGDVTYVDVNQGQQGYRPVYEIKPDIQWQNASISQIEDRINSAMYADLFLMLANDTRSNVTAREIQERHEEKLLQLGPVLERLNDELLDPLIDRVFAIMVRKSIPFWENRIDGIPPIPPPPEELSGLDLGIEYISILAQAQKMVGLQAQDSMLLFASNLAAIKQDPSVLDKLDTDQMIDERADMLGVSPLSVLSDDKVAEIRAGRQQQMRAQQMAAMAPALNQAAGAVEKLGNTPAGEGQSVLQAASQAGAGGGLAAMMGAG